MSLNFDDKGFVFRSGPSKTKKENQYSSFWINNDVDDSEYEELFGTEKPKGRDLVQLAGYKRAIGNFVNIVTGESIPVVFNSKDESFTDGKKVVIGANLNDKNFDVAVGLALHEGSHIKLSDFNFLKHLETNIPQEIYNLGENKGISRMEVVKTIKSLLNYVEDRRIDNFIFSSSPGYKGYYNSMYDKYFYSKNVDKGLLSKEYRTEEIESYMFRIINIHNKNRQLGSLKGLKEIYSTIGLSSISRLKDTDDCFKVACDVSRLIFNSIDKVETPESDDESQGQGGSSDNTMSDEEFDSLLDSIENGDSMSSSDSSSTSNGKTIDVPVQGSPSTPDENLSNDDGSESVELSDRQKELLKKAFQKQEKFLDGDVQKTNMSKKESNDIKAIEESGASYENVGKGVQNYYGYGNSKGTRCLVVKNLTQSIIDSDQFSCAMSWNQKSYGDDTWRSREYNFVEEGLRIGTMLGRKLQVRNEENSTKYTRKDSGRLDKRLISELGFGNSNVFSQTFVDKFNKVFVHLSIDASGSMNGKKWNKAMTSAVAMIKASDMVGNIEVVVSIRTTHAPSNSKTDVPFIMVCYDSRKDNLVKVRKLFPALNVSGTTPEGLCFESIMDELIPGSTSQDSYFINYSDGQPYYGNSEIHYSGEGAESHTRKMVEMMRAKGIKVLSYFIGDSYDSERDNRAFKNMYGSDSEFINVTNVVDVARTMNKRFLTK